MTPRVCFVASLIALVPAFASSEEARLTIDGEAYNVPLGEAFAVRVNGKRVTMRIDPQDDRRFDESGVTFRYPTAFEMTESDGGQDVRVWSFQGRSAALLLQRYGSDLDPDGLREVLVENLAGERKGDPQKVKLTAPQGAYTGTQVRTASAGGSGAPATESVQNVFTFANTEGVFALLVQDTRPPGEGDSEEYVEALRLLGESLKTGKPPTPRRPSSDVPPTGRSTQPR